MKAAPLDIEEGSTMLNHVFRHIFRGRIVGGILRGIGAAMLAGIGWKLGTDAYNSIKKRPKDAETDEY